MYWEQKIQFASLSDIGFRRRMNQDAYVVQTCSDREVFERRGHLFQVADGMGGHAVGELASKIAVDTVPHTFFKSKKESTEASLKRAVQVANSAINDRGSANHDFNRMGTTCSVLVLSPRGAVIGHVGDSRVYRVRDDRVDQLTFDHSLQWELLKQGKMSPQEIFLKEPRNVITRSLGPHPTVDVDIEGPFPVLPGDTYLLCSDGLTGHVNDLEIGSIMKHLPPAEACRLLIHLANLRGGSDNITVVIVRVGELPPGVTPKPAAPEPPPPGGLNWWWLAAFWGLALMFVLGVVLLLLRKYLPATGVLGVTAFAAVGLFSFLWENRPKKQPPSQSHDDTIMWRPYRSASARLAPEFISHLAAIESELQRTALDEGWSIEWPAHRLASERAQQHHDQKELAKALQDYSNAIDALMAGIHQQRKQRQREAKWGKQKSTVVNKPDAQD